MESISTPDAAARLPELLNRVAGGEAFEITTDGAGRAVLMSAAEYDELAAAREAQLQADVSSIRLSMQQIDAGEGQPLDIGMDMIRAKLLAMKAAQAAASGQ